MVMDENLFIFTGHPKSETTQLILRFGAEKLQSDELMAMSQAT